MENVVRRQYWTLEFCSMKNLKEKLPSLKKKKKKKKHPPPPQKKTNAKLPCVLKVWLLNVYLNSVHF